MVKFITILLVLLFSCQASLYAQNVKAKKGSFGIDQNNTIIVWHQKNIDSVVLAYKTVKGFRFKHRYKLVETTKELTYDKQYKISRKGKNFTLYISELPLIQIDVDTSLNSDTKVLGSYRYYNDDIYIKSSVGIEFRGNLSLTYPKKTFDLEFWNDSIRNNSRDLAFEDLRNDDDWILDGMYNEPLRIRSFVANNLWTTMRASYGQNEGLKGKSGIDLIFVELFKNQEYQGVYALSESVDRKLLDLEKNSKNSINGELFKASSYEGAPAFKKAPEFENLFPHWGGFEMVYPILDYKAHWNDLAQLVNLVVNGSDKDFIANIETKLDVQNAMDYFLFVNLLRATDNLGKNYYLARYDKGEPYYFIPWDLDGVMGIIQDGKRIATTDDILSNGLFDRLLKANPNKYREKLKKRWTQLRETHFNEDELLSTIEALYAQMKKDKIYEREQLIWPSERTIEDDYNYLQTWLKNRIQYLDTYFDNL